MSYLHSAWCQLLLALHLFTFLPFSVLIYRIFFTKSMLFTQVCKKSNTTTNKCCLCAPFPFLNRYKECDHQHGNDTALWWLTGTSSIEETPSIFFFFWLKSALTKEKRRPEYRQTGHGDSLFKSQSASRLSEHPFGLTIHPFFGQSNYFEFWPSPSVPVPGPSVSPRLNIFSNPTEGQSRY